MRQVVKALLTAFILIMPTTAFAGECGDVNNDDAVNIFDITYLITFLYLGGPVPDCGPEIGTVTDIDGNMYFTIKIGDQWWMMENLRVTHYRNGDAIPNVADSYDWTTLTTGAYCEYDNDPSNVAVYGRLYNWYAVGDGRNIAPEGWHVPSDDEWKQLEMYLGMSPTDADAEDWRGNNEGGKMKETSTGHWTDPNSDATNESGFTALPGGYRNSDTYGNFYNMGLIARLWSSTEYHSEAAWCRYLSYTYSKVYRYSNISKRNGFSVRCVKD